ncbi:MAG: uracil-DNA glycosylase family protein [Candidatus Cryptobacteroides sp.]|nr:uracil-DNA glycosylase family protein [Bacteroidales bacterium]
MTTENHPFEPFLPANAKILMLGSFPPPEKRWSIVFYYPNFTNDMWRIAGLVFFGDKEHFILRTKDGEMLKKFDKQKIVDFCNQAGIAMYDTACKVVRLKDNASDKFLEVAEASDIPGLLREIPECNAVVTTGEKATDVVVDMFGCGKPAVGSWSEFRAETEPGVFRSMKLYRLPSSSRAYPLALEKKAGAYRKMFIETGVLNPH